MKRFLIASLLIGAVACSKDDDDKDPVADNTAVQDPGQPKPADPKPDEPKPFEVKEVTIDASSSTAINYFALKDGELVTTTKDGAWLIGVVRWMWQTNTTSSGGALVSQKAGAYAPAEKDFDAITDSACDASLYTTDEAQGPYSVNKIISTKWGNTLTASAANPLKPDDINFVVGRESECIKLRVVGYDAEKRIYTVKYKRLK